MPTQDELRSLLETPSESPSVEYKSWLDLTQNPGKAILSKAAIALANDGGGIIVLGMQKTRPKAQYFVPSHGQPCLNVTAKTISTRRLRAIRTRCFTAALCLRRTLSPVMSMPLSSSRAA